MINLRSKLQRDLLGYYFTNPTASHYVRELAGILGADPTNLSRELARLETQGLFRSEIRGRQKYFAIDRSHPLYKELRQLIFKTTGVVGRLRDAMRTIKGLEEAVLYGSFAQNQQDASSDIDVLIVGAPDAEHLEDAMGKLERRLGREINYTLLSPKELQSRRSRKNSFIEDVFRKKHIDLLSR